MEIRKVETLTRGDYYIKHLQVINPFLPTKAKLTPKEIEVLAAFMALDGLLAEDRFGTTARKVVLKQLGISPGGLGNYLAAFREKGITYKKDGALLIAPQILPDKIKQSYNFKLVMV